VVCGFALDLTRSATVNRFTPGIDVPSLLVPITPTDTRLCKRLWTGLSTVPVPDAACIMCPTGVTVGVEDVTGSASTVLNSELFVRLTIRRPETDGAFSARLDRRRRGTARPNLLLRGTSASAKAGGGTKTAALGTVICEAGFAGAF
jgi:hypothetical protein